MELSPTFAYLPNGIIREIIAYTGATYKKRNGKYMGQIPKTDPRFALLLKIPKKNIAVNNHLVSNPNCSYFTSWVTLTRIGQRSFASQQLTPKGASHPEEFGERYYKHPTVRLMVFGVTYINDPIYGNKETIEYECRICDRSGNLRCEKYEYYRKTEQYHNITTSCDNFTKRSDNILTECQKIRKQINLLRNVCIMFGMFTVGLIVRYFR
jgi:hypothetical protein